MVDIATDEEIEAEETPFTKRASKAGTNGGSARARALSPEQRSEI
jgi:hypothetical protein